MRIKSWFSGVCAVVSGALVVVCSSLSFAAGSRSYDFPAAAQEITQVIWLAETASACGWATREEADRFELFAVRFVAAHLQGAHRAALIAMVGDDGYLTRVQRAAVDQSVDTCKQARWQNGWVAYKDAADVNDAKY